MTTDIDSLEHELADLTAHLEVATHRQLAILRALAPTGFWLHPNASSFAHWLSWRIGLAPAPLGRSSLGLDVLACECGHRMKHVANILEKKSLARMLAAHRLDVRAMPTAPARAPPQCQLDVGA